MPSRMLYARPSGKTSISFAVKAVSGASLLTASATRTGPAMWSASSSGGVAKLSTSARSHSPSCRTLWTGPPSAMMKAREPAPPRIGTGSFGS